MIQLQSPPGAVRPDIGAVVTAVVDVAVTDDDVVVLEVSPLSKIMMAK